MLPQRHCNELCEALKYSAGVSRRTVKTTQLFEGFTLQCIIEPTGGSGCCNEGVLVSGLYTMQLNGKTVRFITTLWLGFQQSRSTFYMQRLTIRALLLTRETVCSKEPRRTPSSSIFMHQLPHSGEWMFHFEHCSQNQDQHHLYCILECFHIGASIS